MKTIRVLVVLTVVILLTSCSESSVINTSNIEEPTDNTTDTKPLEIETEEATPTVTSEDYFSYEDILSNENISVGDAYNKMQKTALSKEGKEFLRMLEDLTSCEGRFVQNSDDSEHTYTADVTFILRKGKIYSCIGYSGYMGTISEGEVSKTSDSEYLFETHTVGDFYGQQQSFDIHFGKQLLHIQWGTCCDYVLDRGTGFIEDSVDHDVPFEKSKLFATLVSKIDEAYTGIEHKVLYSNKEKAVYVFFESEHLRDALLYGNDELNKSWDTIVKNMCTLSTAIYNAIHISGAGELAEVYWVEKLHPDNIYSPNEYSLWVENGEIKYNIAKDGQEISNHTVKPEKEYSYKENPLNNNTASHKSSLSFGEKNALKQAKSYLEFTAFSYSGLIEQLEYEGYSYSEAQYAADNCGADWNEQAAKKAAEYLDYMSFSRSALVEQLIYEGFTQPQAEYGVNVAY